MRLRLGLLAVFAAACARAGDQPFDLPAQTAVREAARATLQAYEAAVKSLDSARIAAFYAEDSAFRMVEGQHGLQRPELLALIGSLTRSLSRVEGGFVYDSLAILPLSPTLALVAGPYVDIMTDTAGSTATVRGFVTWQLRRGPQGWQFLYGHAAPVPPQSPSP